MRNAFWCSILIEQNIIMFILRALLSFEVRGFLFAAQLSNDTGGWQIIIQGSQMTTVPE